MRKWVRTSANAALLTAGFVALGVGVSFADGHSTSTAGNGSVIGGNQLTGDGDVPVNLSGNSVGALGGVSGASAQDSGAGVDEDGDDTTSTSGNGSIVGGNQGMLDADVPLNVTGNSVGALLGTSGAASDGSGSSADERQSQAAPAGGSLVDSASKTAKPLHAQTETLDAGPPLHQAAGEGGSMMTSGNGSLLGGNQIGLDGDIPINVTGNSIGALGGVSGAESQDSGAGVEERGDDGATATSGNGSIVGGNQGMLGLDVPLNVTGNSVGTLLGVSGASSQDSGASSEAGGGEADERSMPQAGSPVGGGSLPLSNEVPGAPAGGGTLPLKNELPEPSDGGSSDGETPKEQQPKGQAPEQDQQPKGDEQPKGGDQPKGGEQPKVDEVPAELPGVPKGGADAAQDDAQGGSQGDSQGDSQGGKDQPKVPAPGNPTDALGQATKTLGL